MIKLDPRLQAAADFVLPGRAMADIGTDHAYLPIYLVSSGICPRAIAADKAAWPIQAAAPIIKAHACGDRISLRCGDGLSVLTAGEADTIVLCGMGGQLMMEILQEGQSILQETKRLVLQPQKHIDLLRYWLAEHDWRIVAESIVESKGFFYSIIAAEPGKMELSPNEAQFGPLLLKERSPEFLAWLRWQISEKEGIYQSLQKQSGSMILSRLSELEEELKNMRQLMG